MTIDELVRENDLATKALLPVDKTLVLFGSETSPFIQSIRRKANALGIKYNMGVSQLYADDVGGVVIDTETSNVDPRFIDPILDIDCITPSSSGLSCVASAILALLLGNNLACGKYITIVGRGHAVKGLAPLLTEQGATVTVAHSKTPMVNKATVGADVVVYAVPRSASFGFTLDTKDMVIDLSRVIPYPDLLPHAKYVDRIGKLTVSILLNRFAKNCHRKELS